MGGTCTGTIPAGVYEVLAGLPGTCTCLLPGMNSLQSECCAINLQRVRFGTCRTRYAVYWTIPGTVERRFCILLVSWLLVQ